MILRVKASFKDRQYDNVQRTAGQYIDVPEERAKELIKARVAEKIRIITLDQHAEIEEEQEETPVLDAAFEEVQNQEHEEGTDQEEVPEAEAEVVEKSLEDYTVKELTKMAEEAGKEIPKNAKKAELIDLLK